MMVKRFSKNKIGKTIFGCLFGIIMLFAGMTAIFSTPVSAIGEDDATVQEEQVESDEQPEETEEGEEESEEPAKEERKTSTRPQASCENSLGAIGWLVCPTTGKLAEAVDWLYDKIEEFLIINPVEIKDGSPIYEIWKYMRGVTNIVFIIFLLVVVYSQITGLGITNYGIKKVLPKLIVAAVLMNLSFIICSLAVDLSNIIGSSLRGVFTAVEESTIGTMAIDSGQGMYVTMADAYSSLAGGTMLAVGGGFVAFETGAIWMAIPAAIGAIIAVVVGLLTIALRQAVVALLIMVSPLAIVAYMLPNTEEWFTKWKKLLIRMLVFYPVFSLLFGASSLAGFAIIASAVSRSDGFMLIVGLVVQVFPLFFAWSLMKMSGTVLGTINTKLRGLAAKPLASTRSWAESRRESTKMRHLASNNVYTPSLYLRQYLNDRKIHREEEMKENAETVKNRGLAYDARKHYKNFDKSILNDDGKNAYADQARNAEYQNVLIRHKANMNRGFGWALEAGSNEWREISELDKANVRAFDRMKQEQARAEKIDLDNTKGYHTRMETAMNAHMDKLHWDKTNKEGKLDYERHFESQETTDFKDALNRYNDISKVMDDNTADVQYAAAYAAHAYDTQNKIIQNKFQKYFELVPPTRDVRYRLEELSKLSQMNPDGTFKTRAVDNIDTIISGLKVLNQRGDTDFVKDILDDIWDSKYGGLELGTHASQAIASFLMFDVKDNDPYLRRFGKYINLETARRFDHNERQKETVDYAEYIRGYHVEPDGTIMHAKKDIVKLMEGTSLDGVERTAFDNYDSSLRKVYTDSEGKFDVDAYEERRREIDKATGPQFISANLKYLSGSEQIVSAVKSKTGFAAVQDKATGKYNMVPIWDDPREDKKLFEKYSDEEKAEAKKGLKEFYRVQTLQYLKDQTPAQILGLRSDYKEPLLEHLSASYLLNDDGTINPERLGKHEQELLEIDNDDFGETDPDKINEKRAAARDALKMREAGEEFRELLYEKGKLAQIEKSKRSGAANNAKDWVRSLLLLDSKDELGKWILDREHKDRVQNGNPDVGDAVNNNTSGVGDAASSNTNNSRRMTSETTINPEVVREQQRQQEQKQRERQAKKEMLMKMIKEIEEQQKMEGDANLTSGPQNISVYNVDKVNEFKTRIEDLWYEVRDKGLESSEYDDFYNESHEYVTQVLGAESYVVKSYEKYYEDNPSGDSYDMREYLIDLLKTLLDD